MELFTVLLSVLDIRLVPFVLVLNVLGYWLKRNGLPKWCLPLPLLNALVSFVICAVFGWIVTDAEGAKAVVMAIVFYGLGNGLLISFVATYGYDVVHAFTKKKAAKLANIEKEEG